MNDHLLQQHNGAASLIFRLKTFRHQLIRLLKNFKSPVEILNKDNPANFPHLLASSVSSLWDVQNPQEYRLTLGKVQNLRVASPALSGLLIPQGQIFSFWRQVGRLTKRKGYVTGRELRSGCLVPALGGGICQLSNALYDVALQAGFEIVERHAHTKTLPNALAARGRDATVFWNYVDFRFRAGQDALLIVTLDADNLSVALWGKQPLSNSNATSNKSTPSKLSHVNSCDLCGQTACAQALDPNQQKQPPTTSFVLDECWPEYRAYVSQQLKPHDEVLQPLDGKRWRKKNYAWDILPSTRKTAAWRALKWAFKMRRLAQQGRARQLALQNRDREVARALAQKISSAATHVVVMQNFLPFLFLKGVLAGRSFDVLMTRWPLKILHQKLDAAHALWPDSTTLGDFRADEDLVMAEWQALLQARRILTPHTGVARCFPEKTILLPWYGVAGYANEQKPRQKSFSKKVVFPATTLARKGSHLVRQLLQTLPFELVVLGNILEDPDFWQGLPVTRKSWTDSWWQDADLVILPAIVEFKPRALLMAQSKGIPIVASDACGLAASADVEVVSGFDFEVWKAAVAKAIRRE